MVKELLKLCLKLITAVFYTGHCITTAYPGEVCDLNSYAVGCDRNGLSATACRCYQTADNQNDTACDGIELRFRRLAYFSVFFFFIANANFSCEEGSVPSICPGGRDDSPFLGCFPTTLFCNLASDCPGGIDELNCTGS